MALTCGYRPGSLAPIRTLWAGPAARSSAVSARDGASMFVMYETLGMLRLTQVENPVVAAGV